MIIEFTQSGLTPKQLRLEFVALNRHDHLLVVALHHVAVVEHPFASTLWFVVLELSLEIGPVGVCPSPCHKPVLAPLTHVLHSSCVEDVSASAMLFAVEPFARVDILVGVDKHALALLLPAIPLAIVLTFVRVNQPPYTVFEVVLEIPIIDVTVGVSVLALAAPELNRWRCYAIEVLAVVGLSVGVSGLTFACVVFGAVGGLSVLRGELIRNLFFFLLFRHLAVTNYMHFKTGYRINQIPN